MALKNGQLHWSTTLSFFVTRPACEQNIWSLYKKGDIEMIEAIFYKNGQPDPANILQFVYTHGPLQFESCPVQKAAVLLVNQDLKWHNDIFHEILKGSL